MPLVFQGLIGLLLASLGLAAPILRRVWREACPEYIEYAEMRREAILMELLDEPEL